MRTSSMSYLLVAASLTACSDSSTGPAPQVASLSTTAAAATTRASETVPLDRTVWVSCANGGAGEDVHLTGELRMDTFSQVNGRGASHDRLHVQPIGVTGVGLVTGRRYQGTGGTTEQVIGAADGTVRSYTMVNNFRLIGQGPGNNLSMHLVIHETVDANGNPTASVSVMDSNCR